MRFFGFELKGLRDPLTLTGANAKKPVLFTNFGLSLSQLPVEFAGYTIRPLLPPGKDLGENWQGDPRGALLPGGDQAIDLPEDKLGSLGMILQQDPKANSWYLEKTVITAEAASPIAGLRVYGKSSYSLSNSPQVGSVYWIENEAFYCTAVAATSSGGSSLGWSLTLDRAACGSYAERHEVDPAAYTGDGIEARLELRAKPDWEANRFKGAIYCWILPKGRTTTATELQRNYFFIDKPPDLIEEAGNYLYRIIPRAISDVVGAHRFSLSAKSVQSPFRVQVIELEHENTSSGYICRPKKAKMAFPRSKAEKLFRHCLHLNSTGVVQTTLVDDLRTRLAGCAPDVEHRTFVKAAGGWVFKILDINKVSVKGQSCLELDLELVDFERGATIASAPPPPAPPQGAGTVALVSPFDKGWSYNQGTPLRDGEEAPSAELRWRFNCSPIKAALIVLLSRCGASGGAYDKMIGFQLGLPASWVNTGTAIALGTELTIDPRTKEMLKLDQLINETINPEFAGEDTAGAFFQDLCLLYLLLFAGYTTGAVGLRRWASEIPTGLTAIRPLKGTLGAGELLTPLRAVKLMSGVLPLDLKPEFERVASLGGVKTVEGLTQAIPLRVWKPGNAISDDALKSEAFTTFFKALFTVLGGSPRAYPVNCALEIQNFDPGDVIQYTDPRPPTPEGRGFNAVRFLIVSKDVNYRLATVTYKVLRDYFNESTTTAGYISPALEIVDIIARSSPGLNRVVCQVKVVGSNLSPWVIASIWDTLIADGGRVRVYYPDAHNPESEQEREGYAEVSAYAYQRDVDTRRRLYTLTLEIDPAWDRDYVTAWYTVVRRGARIVLTDYRIGEANPEFNLIEPHDLQLYSDGEGGDYAKWAGFKTFDNGYTLISDVP